MAKRATNTESMAIVEATSAARWEALPGLERCRQKRVPNTAATAIRGYATSRTGSVINSSVKLAKQTSTDLGAPRRVRRVESVNV